MPRPQTMERPMRLAACEPCRQLKLACDHSQPTCSRCIRSGRGDTCTYRERPFKKRRRNGNSQIQVCTGTFDPLQAGLLQPTLPSEQAAEERHYPNAGHLGFSSHVTIFNRLPTDDDAQEPSLNPPIPATPGSTLSTSRLSNQQVQVLEEVLNTIDAGPFKNLVDFWLAKRINLALGGPFVGTCTQTLQQLSAGKLFNGSSLAAIAQKVSENSARSLDIGPTSSWTDFCSEFSNTNLRWETIALALLAVGRATTDVSFFPPLYTCRAGLRAFQRSVTNLADKCLELALSLDFLNEIQLICQYESFILHSMIDGDQSYTAWRRLGDVISSLLFLGFNEKIENGSAIPMFLSELRRSAFAQIYSDDKNVAVFLGRAPRLNRRFCCFQLPSASREEAWRSSTPRPMADENYVFFGPGDRFDHVTGLRWTTCCASLKEEILEALQKHDGQPEVSPQHFAAIYSRAESLWCSLPTRLKIKDSLRSHDDLPSFERDFLLGVRLTYLQILFLLTNGIVSQGNVGTDDEELRLLQISQEMLSLIVEAIVLREQLVNSGTSLLWKVAHYGLPAAGVICLFMLRPAFWRSYSQSLLVPKIMQDLGVFATEVQVGGLLRIGDPNYALLHRATSTIQSLLRAALSSDGPLAGLRRINCVGHGLSRQEIQQQADQTPLHSLAYTDLWGYEYDFWQDLSEHPSLLTLRL